MTHPNGQPRFSDADLGPPLFSKFTLAELCEAYPDLSPPVIEGLLREGETCNVIASPKVGKSWFVYNLALSTVMGWSLFDRFPTKPGKVLLVDNELHRQTLAQRIPVVAEAMGIPEFDATWKDDIEIWPLRGDLRSIRELGREFESIERHEYKLVILDAKYRFAIEGTSENDNAAEAQFYNRIDRYADLTGAAFVLIHHSTKGSQSEKRVTDVGAGAGAQSRAADCHLVLREHEQPNHVVLDAAVRSFKPVEPVVLRWEFPLWRVAEGMDASELKGTKTKQQEKQEQDDRDGTHLIVSAMLGGKRLTPSQLRKATHMGQPRVDRLLVALFKGGHIDRSSVTVRGNETHEYWLADTSE